MKARVKWVDNASFVATSGSGHSVVLDGPPDHGGENQGFRPMEMLLIGMGGCTAFDVVSILKKARQQIQDVHVEVEAERSDSVPKVFTHIRVHFHVIGQDLQEKQVERAIKLSTEKYCSASIMLGKTAEISHDYIISEPEQG